MPSFDIVCEINMHEVTNAYDQIKREIAQRYDFKGSKSSIELKDNLLIVLADDDMKMKALQQMIKEKFAKRGVNLKSLIFEEEKKVGGDLIRQEVKIKNALEQEELKRLNKAIKDSKIKVQGSIQGEQLRVTGKKRDDLQEVMAYLKQNIQDLPLSFTNFRE